jgi:predicted small lipoprotein YifL
MISRWLLGLLGLLQLINGLWMLLAPESWYAAVPGVTLEGPFNHHFIGDIGFAFIASGAGMLMAFRPGKTAATLALAGCGRKGGLDLPPTAAAPPPGAAQAEGATATPGSVFDPSFGANKDPVAPPGKKRSFILDPLLD